MQFEGEGRVVYRLSGTGTTGATLRVYIERREIRPEQLGLATQVALQDLVRAGLALAEIEPRTGRDQPSVMT